MKATQHDRMDAVAAAKAEAARLWALEQEWTAKRVAAAMSVQTTQLAGAAVLDGGDLDTLAGESAQAQGRVAVADAALEEVRRRRVVAIRAIWQAEAAALRVRAAACRAEADERQPKTDALLAELTAWEGIRYVPDPGSPGESFIGVDGPQGGAMQVRWIATPKTVLLRQEAAGYEAQAQQREAQTISEGGQAVAFSRDELLADLDSRGALALAPARHLVLLWLDEGEALETMRRAKFDHDPRPTRYLLNWRKAAILPRESGIGPSAEW